ncbi:hypothetical protein H5203_21490 [Pseudoalteromonas sp. SG41-1]|uniref:hypothetical protein n=1 Tax=Pseudoalteromonas sp. SG41-1 TaxID=2760979 RepID=UPI001600858B|nr:hypothetical protein [Pseudoalteromonas sp. SG41-1]MBB1508020.1 hypothetical protein [Pseudoalteromonas sp. SG41-1]
MKELNARQLTNGITRSIIKGAIQNKELLLNNTPIHLSVEHDNDQSTVIISTLKDTDTPQKQLFIMDVDRTPFLNIDTKDPEQLKPAYLKIYETTKVLEYVDSETPELPYHIRLGITDSQIVEFINNTVNESHNYVNYKYDGRHMVKSLSSFDDYPTPAIYFLRAVISKQKIDDFFFQLNIDDKALLSNGIRPNTYDKFKNEVIDFFFNKENPYFSQVFQNLIVKVEDELVDTVNYDFESVTEPKPPKPEETQKIDGIAERLELLKLSKANKRKYG